MFERPKLLLLIVCGYSLRYLELFTFVVVASDAPYSARALREQWVRHIDRYPRFKLGSKCYYVFGHKSLPSKYHVQ